MTFYFYDLETSGFRWRQDRIIQFAGQRTDMDLKPIGEPDNILIKMTPDVLPEPGAILVHGITPQKTLAEGVTEAEFCEYLTSQVSIKDTIFVGYNSIRFDNEFIRFTLWRNFYDAYEWSWKNNCSIWDLLDVVRMTRALRPDRIEWPYAPDGKPTNSLEYITAVNKLDHDDAHDAMGDVRASLAVARLLKQKQPQIFEHLLNIRGKQKAIPLITRGEPLIYTSGRYPADFYKTTVAVLIAEKPDKSAALMYDLRINPDKFKDLSVAELTKRWLAWQSRKEDAAYFPVKELKYNRCPAVAPLDWLDETAAQRIKIQRQAIDSHFQILKSAAGFGDRLIEAQDGLWPPRQPQLIIDEQKVDGQLYDAFVRNEDKTKMSVVRAAKPAELSELHLDFQDNRLVALLPIYKARNFSEALTDKERQWWLQFRHQKLLGGKSNIKDRFLAQIEDLSKMPGLSNQKRLLLKELEAYCLSVTQHL